jgi:hypothetical protein
MFVFKTLLRDLLNQDPGKEADQESKQRHCDGVRAIRESRQRFLRLIKDKRFYWDNVA